VQVSAANFLMTYRWHTIINISGLKSSVYKKILNKYESSENLLFSVVCSI